MVGVRMVWREAFASTCGRSQGGPFIWVELQAYRQTPRAKSGLRTMALVASKQYDRSADQNPSRQA